MRATGYPSIFAGQHRPEPKYLKQPGGRQNIFPGNRKFQKPFKRSKRLIFSGIFSHLSNDLKRLSIPAKHQTAKGMAPIPESSGAIGSKLRGHRVLDPADRYALDRFRSVFGGFGRFHPGGNCPGWGGISPRISGVRSATGGGSRSG